MELDELDARWNRRWPHLRPLGHELRTADFWVRFHSLPGSKRYPDSEPEYDELLRRHNVVLRELVGRPGVANVLLLTASWSTSGTPVPLDAPLVDAVADAQPWRSVLLDEYEGEQSWTHVHVSVREWTDGALDAVLRLVADDATGEVIIAADDLRWLYHPYDGGGDVLVPTLSERDHLRRRHSDWLSGDERGL